MRGFVVGFVCAFVVFIMLAVGALAAPSITVVGSPEVVVANPPENFSQDGWNPEYVFSAAFRVANDDVDRRVNAFSIAYADPEVEGCPQDEDEPTWMVMSIWKQRNMEAGETRVFGGETGTQEGQGDAFWPMAVPQAFQDGSTGEEHTFEDEVYTFCGVVLIGSDDPDCDEPSFGDFCVADTDTYRAFVRHENQPPEVTTFSIGDENPRPGQEVLLQGDGEDADDEPRPDDLLFTWRIDGAEHTGQTARHTFGPAGSYTVTLEVTDGFDTVTESREVVVEGQGDGLMPEETPLPGVLALLGVVAAVGLSRPRGAR